ncbi:MAG TPA: hypothetical protein VM733_12630 [Thermoanaerobaculia bacterium]|nr:hypothetical protein [Thermoanaerobaculia bacterium]
MATWVRVLLIAIAAGFVVLVAGIIFAARWVRQRGEALKPEGAQVSAEARAFGEGKDAGACVAESMRRLQSARGFMGEARVRVFLRSCLEAATVTPEACAGVPKREEILKTVRWSMDECARRGRPKDQRCTRILGELQERCER